MTKTDRMAKAIQQRDGLDCFLCGKTHSSLARMSIGFVATEATKQNLENAYLACTGCNKRRNNRQFGAYIRQRLNEVRAEIAYLENTFNKDNENSHLTQAIWASLNRPIISIEEDGETVENPSLARDIQDVPWKELLSKNFDLDAFKALNKTPASEHEELLIHVLEDLATFNSGLQKEPSFERGSEEGGKKAHFYCAPTDRTIPCQWEGQKQHDIKIKKT
jgi:hypothetical protein